MKCNKCNHEIERPLELYNGRWCCPNCKKDIFPDVDTQLVITAHNRELYVRSEEYYFKWLTSSDERKSVRFKYLDKAVSLCYASAFEYHPSALMRMGYYYDRGYADFSSAGAERWRAAYFYYKAVLFNTHKGVVTGEGEDRYVDELTQIKLQCGKYMIDLLKQAPLEVVNKISFDGYENLDKLRAEVVNKIVSLGGSAEKCDVKSIAEQEQDTSAMAYASLRACKDEERAPVFAIFKLSKAEAQKLILDSSDSDFSIVESVGKDLRLKIAEAYDGREIDGKFAEFRSSNALVNYAKNKCPDKGIYLCFINWLGGHKYLKKRDVMRIYSAMDESSCAVIKLLIRAGKYNSCVFYDDDFFRYDEGRKGLSKKEIDKFVKEVCEEN